MDEENKILPSSDGHHNRADMKLIERSRRGKWAVKPEIAQKAVEVVARIAQKDSIKVACKDGAIEVDNDANQIRAVATLLEIEKMNQADDQFDEKNKRLDEGKPTENTAIIHTLEFQK